eukprot:1315352-Prymnesium_polylepis.1
MMGSIAYGRFRGQTFRWTNPPFTVAISSEGQWPQSQTAKKTDSGGSILYASSSRVWALVLPKPQIEGPLLSVCDCSRLVERAPVQLAGSRDIIEDEQPPRSRWDRNSQLDQPRLAAASARKRVQ